MNVLKYFLNKLFYFELSLKKVILKLNWGWYILQIFESVPYMITYSFVVPELDPSVDDGLIGLSGNFRSQVKAFGFILSKFWVGIGIGIAKAGDTSCWWTKAAVWEFPR